VHNPPRFRPFAILGLSPGFPHTSLVSAWLSSPYSFWTLLCLVYIALFCQLLMCSTNICRQPSPILSTISFYSLSVLFSHPLPLSRNHTLSRTPQKSFRIRHYIHLFIMRLLLFSPYIPRLPSLVHRLSLYYILYADSTLAQHTRKYMTSTVVVQLYSFTLFLWWGVVLGVAFL